MDQNLPRNTKQTKISNFDPAWSSFTYKITHVKSLRLMKGHNLKTGILIKKKKKVDNLFPKFILVFVC